VRKDNNTTTTITSDGNTTTTAAADTASLGEVGLAANFARKLRNVDELERFVLSNNEAFGLEFVSEKIERLIKNWNNLLYGPKKARLFQLRYSLSAKLRSHATTPRKPKAFLRRQTTPATKAEQLAEDLADLQKGRNVLAENHGADPLEESTALAAEAQQQHQQAAGHGNKRQKTAAVHFELPGGTEKDDDDDNVVEVYHHENATEYGLFEDSSDEEKDGRRDPHDTTAASASHHPMHPDMDLSIPTVPMLAPGGPPTGVTVDEANNPFYIGPQPDPGVFDAKGNVLIKRPWTEEETQALIHGMRTFGAGRWVQIKNLYGEIFKNRSSVMLKDKFRNLRRQKKLPDDVLLPLAHLHDHRHHQAQQQQQQQQQQQLSTQSQQLAMLEAMAQAARNEAGEEEEEDETTTGEEVPDEPMGDHDASVEV
jgi:Myb-like DNA-binding domain